MNKTFSVIFCTCDKYEDLWDNFFLLFNKYWPDFNGEILFNSEYKSYTNPLFNNHIKSVKHNGRMQWSDRLNDALKQATSDFVLIFLDDYFLHHKVDTQRFKITLQYLQQHPTIKSLSYLREPGLGKPVLDLPGFCERKHFALYKATAHVALYDKVYLQHLLRSGEDAWAFEVNATFRSWFNMSKHLCAQNNEHPIFPYDFSGWSLCMKGKYYRPVKEYFEKTEHLSFDERRETVDQIDTVSRNTILHKISKLKYPLKAFLSFFRKKPL